MVTRDTRVDNRGHEDTMMTIPGTLAMQSRWDEHTWKHSSTSAGLLASMTVTLEMEWVEVQIQTREESSCSASAASAWMVSLSLISASSLEISSSAGPALVSSGG